MTGDLTPPEVRVLGALVEKALSTPEYYPLTRNALVAACNQKLNRDPVTIYGEEEVGEALDLLQRKRLVALQTGAGSRAEKFRHLLDAAHDLSMAHLALLAELMLRGPQTPGELRTRTARMHGFDTLETVEAELQALQDRESPLVVQLPAQAGRREQRYAHLFSGDPEEAPASSAETRALTPVGALADEVEVLKERMAALEEAFERFRQQFE